MAPSQDLKKLIQTAGFKHLTGKTVAELKAQHDAYVKDNKFADQWVTRVDDAIKRELREGLVLDYLVKSEVPTITEDQLLELMAPTQLGRVHVGRLTKEKFPNLKDDVYMLRNESPIVQELIDMLGVPKDGSAIRIRTGYMKLGPKAGMLFFAKNKTDLPGETASSTVTKGDE